MTSRPTTRPDTAARIRHVLAITAGVVLAGQLATGAPGHAADLPLTSEKLTVHIVGNPP